ncbi:ABC transporter ATP-binding protein [Carboxydochorda subterranea]|uniref:ABC transporter ATP-binding protein n=1 Tax=Carboxydichorda subterranea TaxID=3109565 RepID=A0ABZ1BV65_9FIRM|nr:ABC transporter ATP-binding protein [Limnochorda sp. L945t]WRP16691.1 ABC transporter ATP-binding protein [Limnochorda sp. L945t]
MIELVGVGKQFGRRWAVQDLTCSVEQGEVLGFLGPNGAGKTTTMRMVTGYMPPTTGSVRVAGIDALDDPVRLKRRVGYLPETPPIYGEMTVRGFLHFVAEMRGVPRHRRRRHVDHVMEQVGVADVAGRLAGRLSRGYRQRVGLAAALVGDPPVLVLDEPTSGMDPQQIVEMRRLIKDLAGRHTVLLSSHILPEVASTCQRVLIINRGRLIAQDSPQKLSLRLRQGQRLRLEVRGEPARVEAALSEVPGVQDVHLASGDGEWARDRVRVELQLATDESGASGGGTDPREAIFFAMARHGLPILEMRSMDLSLEEVFMQLVTHENLAGPDAQAPGTAQPGR